jgi:hypothetical protein
VTGRGFDVVGQIHRDVWLQVRKRGLAEGFSLAIGAGTEAVNDFLRDNLILGRVVFRKDPEVIAALLPFASDEEPLTCSYWERYAKWFAARRREIARGVKVQEEKALDANGFEKVPELAFLGGD